MSRRIWVAAIDQRSDISLYAGETKEALKAQLYAYVKHWWDDLGDNAPPIDSMSVDDAIDYYFEDHPDGEWCAWYEVEVAS
jgi:hypothetical protein